MTTERNLYFNPDPSMAGKPYRPLNMFEADDFKSLYCGHCCVGFCAILEMAIAHRIDDPEYPKEWVHRADGQPTCTSFEEEI